MAQVERRGAVRVSARLAMEIAVEGGTAQVESLNVSANGVYFSSPTYIPILTKLRITLDLPVEGASRSQSVACDGVVVRTEPEVEDSTADEYSVACFFTSITDEDQALLERYVLTHAPF